MKKNIFFNLFVFLVLGLFGFIFIISTQLNYLNNLSMTGALNAVVAILLDFRAYDTLGEILVIFVTISGITLLIKKKK